MLNEMISPVKIKHHLQPSECERLRCALECKLVTSGAYCHDSSPESCFVVADAALFWRGHIFISAFWLRGAWQQASLAANIGFSTTFGSTSFVSHDGEFDCASDCMHPQSRPAVMSRPAGAWMGSSDSLVTDSGPQVMDKDSVASVYMQKVGSNVESSTSFDARARITLTASSSCWGPAQSLLAKSHLMSVLFGWSTMLLQEQLAGCELIRTLLLR